MERVSNSTSQLSKDFEERMQRENEKREELMQKMEQMTQKLDNLEVSLNGKICTHVSLPAHLL